MGHFPELTQESGVGTGKTITQKWGKQSGSTLGKEGDSPHIPLTGIMEHYN